MPRRPPLATSYPTKVALVLLALCPNIVLTTATQLLQPQLLHDLHTSATALQMTEGLSNAGYAFGAVLAVALLQKLPGRRLLLGYEAIFVGGSVLAAAAPDLTGFAAGRILEGFATGLLLVAALPPLVTKFPAAKLPVTVAVVDVGLFGAVTAGPLVGGLTQSYSAWRALFIGIAVLGALGFTAGFFSVDHQGALNPDHRLDKSALVLAALATSLPFIGASLLESLPFASPEVLGPLVVGLLVLLALVITEYRRREPLTPMRLLTHTYPMTGLLAAMVTGAAAVALLELAQLFLVQATHTSALTAGALFWPQVAGIAVAAMLFGAVFRTRLIPVLVAVGALALIGSAVLTGLLSVGSGHLPILLIAAGIGFGAGATVAPGLFLAALAVPSAEIGPAFALVELLRSEAAFLVAPVVLHVAMTPGSSPGALTRGINYGGWAMAGLVGLGVVALTALLALGGARLRRPDLVAWLENGGEALDSPPLAAAVR